MNIAEQKKYHEWLETLQVGDEVIATVSNRPAAIAKIARVTPTQFIVNGARFRRSTGSQIGSYSFRNRLYEVTPEGRQLVETAARRARFRTLTHRGPDGFTDAEIEVMLAALDQYRAAQPGGAS